MSKAIVSVVTEVVEIPGALNIQVARVLGENVIVSKSVKVGDVGVYFPTETQLSKEYCYENNLNRHGTDNKNPEKTGFFDANRRVRAQPFMKIKSQGYFAGFESLSYLPDSVDGLKDMIGFTFDEMYGKPICNKYISQATRDAIDKAAKNGVKQAKVVSTPYFEKHVDSAQFKHNVSLIPKGALIHFHAKVHGTSHRSGLTLVKLALPKWKEFINKYVPIFPTEKWDYVVGTRNVVLTPGKNGFHGSEQFRFDVAEMLKPYMDKGMTVYGEIAGYANGKPIMAVHNGKDTKDKAFVKKFGEQIVYKYNCAEHEYRFHVYRITRLTTDGQNIDMSEAQLEQWCADRGLNGPVNVCPPYIYNGNTEILSNLVELYTERAGLPSAGEDYIDPSHPGEGIILRIDTGKANPYFLKSKAHNFRVMEGMCEAVDMEDVAAASDVEVLS